MITPEQITQRLYEKAEAMKGDKEPLTLRTVACMQAEMLEEYTDIFWDIVDDLEDREETPDDAALISLALHLIEDSGAVCNIGLLSVGSRHAEQEIEDFHRKIEET